MPVDVATAAQVHAALAWIVVLLTVTVALLLRAFDGPPSLRRSTRDLLVVLLAQGALGYVQYATDLPEVLVGLHLLGSALVWIAVLRLLLALRDRGLPEGDGTETADGADGTAAAAVPTPAGAGREKPAAATAGS